MVSSRRQPSLYWVACVAALACGGGNDGAQPSTAWAYLEAVPSEKVLCSFTFGVTTRAEVTVILGEPTDTSERLSGSTLSTGSETPRSRLLRTEDRESCSSSSTLRTAS